jgi:hypothetical protein
MMLSSGGAMASAERANAWPANWLRCGAIHRIHRRAQMTRRVTRPTGTNPAKPASGPSG